MLGALWSSSERLVRASWAWVRLALECVEGWDLDVGPHDEDAPEETLSAPNPLLCAGVKAGGWLECPKSPKAEVPDKALKSVPPRKLANGKPPKDPGVLLSIAVLPTSVRLAPSAGALSDGDGRLFWWSWANEGCIIRSKNAENCGPDTGLLGVFCEALVPPKSGESLNGAVLVFSELMGFKLMVLV